MFINHKNVLLQRDNKYCLIMYYIVLDTKLIFKQVF